MTDLFSPFTLGGLELPNRVVMAPMTRNYSPGNVVNDKVAFFEPRHIASAYQKLDQDGYAPRGFMFWVIGEEGSNGVEYTTALNRILQLRTSSDETIDEL